MCACPVLFWSYSDRAPRRIVQPLLVLKMRDFVRLLYDGLSPFFSSFGESNSFFSTRSASAPSSSQVRQLSNCRALTGPCLWPHVQSMSCLLLVKMCVRQSCRKAALPGSVANAPAECDSTATFMSSSMSRRLVTGSYRSATLCPARRLFFYARVANHRAHRWSSSDLVGTASRVALESARAAPGRLEVSLEPVPAVDIHLRAVRRESSQLTVLRCV